MQPNWHTLSVAESLRLQGSSAAQGLAVDEVEKRLTRFGPNELSHKRSFRVLRIILRLVSSPLSLILVVVAGVTSFLHEWVDTGVILFVLTINVLIGTFQEGRARRVFDVLAASQTKHALLIRDGKRVIVPANAVVPGDILMLEGGVSVVADARLISVSDLQVNEASLTGEWVPVLKSTEESSLHTGIRKRNRKPI